jgi:hypothetical protein
VADVISPIGFMQKMTVYTRSPNTGPGSGGYDVEFATGIDCRLSTLRIHAASTGPERRELAQVRMLMWDPSVRLPDGVQVAVDGEVGADGVTPLRWNISNGTMNLVRDQFSAPSYWRADVMGVR